MNNTHKSYVISLILILGFSLCGMYVHANEEGQEAEDPHAHFYHMHWRASAWIPDEAYMPVIRGILFLGNGAGSDSRESVRLPLMQEWAFQHGFVLVGSRAGNFCEDEHWEAFAPQLHQMIEDSGRLELHNAPFLLWGHSNGGQQAYGMARRFPERAIAFIVNKGKGQNKEAGTDPWGVPSLWIAGRTDQQTRRDNISGLYLEGRAQGAPWAWLEEHRGHARQNSQALAFAFFEEVLPLRYPHDPNNVPTVESAPTLRPLDQSTGWLVDSSEEEWSSGYMGIRHQADFDGDPLSLGWVPTERTAIIFRATGSWDPLRQLQRNRNGKFIHITGPRNHLGWIRAVRYHDAYDPNEPFILGFTIEENPDWEELRIYDYDEVIHTIPASDKSEFEIPLTLDPSRHSHAIHVEMQLRNGEKRTSQVIFTKAGNSLPARD